MLTELLVIAAATGAVSLIAGHLEKRKEEQQDARVAKFDRAARLAVAVHRKAAKRNTQHYNF